MRPGFNKSRHVLQIIADGSPGGGTTFVLGLCDDLLKNHFWNVSVVTKPESYASRRASELGIATYDFDFFTSRFDVHIPWKLKCLLGQMKPDLVHVHGGRAAIAFAHGPLGKSSYPLIYTVHGYHFVKKPWPMRSLGLLAERRIAARVNHICFVSNNDLATARWAGILGTTPHEVIYNGINLDIAGAFTPDVTHELVFAGRMVRQKNPLFALDVLHALRNDGVRLLMVGGGDLEANVRVRAEQLGVSHLLTLTGTLSHAETLVALRKARLCLFPSLWEGLPIIPMEAMFLGVPVVASKVKGTDEVVVDGETGVLIDDFRPVTFAAAIRSLLSDPSGRKRLAENGRRRVEALFDRRICSARYAELYARVGRVGPKVTSTHL